MVKLIGGWIDLNEKYGDMFKGDFNPNISNKNTLKVLSLTHHCPDCKAPPQKKCFLQLHFAYCDECGERFGVWARKGCARHPYSLGYNVIFKAVRDHWPDAAIEKLLAEGGSIPEECFSEDGTDFVPPFMLNSPMEENDRYGFLRCINTEQAQLENKAAVSLLDFTHGIQGPQRVKSVEETVSVDTGVVSPTKNGLLEDGLAPIADAKVQAQPSSTTPRVTRTGQPSRRTEWLPSGMKKRDAKILRQMRATIKQVEKIAAATSEQAEKDTDVVMKELQKAKRAIEKTKREEEDARKGKTRHRWK
ncbi:hypothetical protein ACET3X_007163 [Alternaria dauci]|uniref:Uncharacterized protein n=1 Tax=Alternaria dauci TaxID=48095 RepID=A0ABR3UGL6_9PLEO